MKAKSHEGYALEGAGNLVAFFDGNRMPKDNPAPAKTHCCGIKQVPANHRVLAIRIKGLIVKGGFRKIVPAF